ncbi:VanW family protein [Candidatus Peregrinibacteria bacterium]|nr:MAG: VanW family protein [Candidatus Peregrinibacteria bacterium]
MDTQNASHLKRSLQIGALMLFIFSAFLVIADEKRIPEGYVLEGVPLSSLTVPEALVAIDGVLDSLRSKPIVLQLGTREEVTVTPTDLGIEFSAERTLSTLPVKHHWFAQLLASELPSESGSVRPAYPVATVNRPELEARLTTLFSEYASPATNAQMVWSENTWTGDGSWAISPEKEGWNVSAGESARIANLIVEESQSTRPAAPILVSYDSLMPTQRYDDLVELKDRLSALTAPITLVRAEQNEVLSPTDSSDWIVVDSEARTALVNQEKVRAWVQQYSQQWDRPAGEVRISGFETRVSEYDQKSFKKATYEGSFERGLSVDQEKLFQDLVTAFHAPEAERMVTVPIHQTNPTVVGPQEYGSFNDLLGVGRSNFSMGNQADRVTNISLSLGAFDAVLIEPGEEFSMNRTTGWITPNKGYTKTKVLYGGAVGYGIGGGVCQSSTTLYRAVVNAGLKVTERRAHSLDVSYYHQYGYGIDAAVFTANEQDFRFVNDSEYPILVHTYLTDDDEAFVEFYGTWDGRTVELTNINTGIRTYKKWAWNVTKNGTTDHRLIQTFY